MLRLDSRGSPQSPCPLVHPFPSLVPNPTRNPATTYPSVDTAGAPVWSSPATVHFDNIAIETKHVEKMTSGISECDTTGSRRGVLNGVEEVRIDMGTGWRDQRPREGMTMSCSRLASSSDRQQVGSTTLRGPASRRLMVARHYRTAAAVSNRKSVSTLLRERSADSRHFKPVTPSTLDTHTDNL